MKTSSCKAKGRLLQKHVASKIQEKFNLPEDDVVSRPMGSGGEDCLLSDRARQLVPLSIECKNTKTFPSVAALEQAKAWNKYTACVVWKPPRKSMEESLIYFKLDDFLDLLRKLNDKETNI